MRDVRKTSIFVAGLLCWGMTCLPAMAQLSVGRSVEVRIDSARDYRGAEAGGVERVWSEEIHRPGATYIAIHFVDFELAPGDKLVVSDATGGQRYSLDGRGKRDAGTFWARHVKGETVRLELFAAGPSGGRGFVIDEIAEGVVPLGTEATEAICGLDDKENAACYQATHPTEHARGRAVARLLINGRILCTGWLVSPNSHLLTNQHCIGGELAALNTDFEFMAEAPACADANCQLCHPGTLYSGGVLIRENALLDYSLILIDGGNPAEDFGHLEIDDRRPVVGEEIYIPQHPRGWAKQLAIFSSDPADVGGVCRVSTDAAPSCVGTTAYNDVGYSCDTEGGSSGSPVLARSSHKVIALHHCANCPNRGVPIGLIQAEIASLLVPQCSIDSECDDGLFCNGPELCVNSTCVSGPDPCGVGQACREDSDTCVAVCDFDGVCESEEDCINCPSDCVSGPSGGGVCGNAVCELGAGENCLNCPEDCNGRTSGPVLRQFCCGGLTGCYAPLCDDKGNTCTFSVASDGSYCCGDGLCSPGEDNAICAVDCSSPVVGCDSDGVCEIGEDCRTCPSDCPGRLKGKPSNRYCCGNGVTERPENPEFCDDNP